MGTEKVDGGYENVGENPPAHPHKFHSKKKADDQRKAMFANGFKAHEAIGLIDKVLDSLVESLGSDSFDNFMNARGGMSPRMGAEKHLHRNDREFPIDAKANAAAARAKAIAGKSASRQTVEAFPNITNANAKEALQMYIDLLEDQPSESSKKAALEAKALLNGLRAPSVLDVTKLLWNADQARSGNAVIGRRRYEKVSPELLAKLKTTPKEGEEDGGFLQTIMNICYDDWQLPENEGWSWNQFIDHILSTYGPEAAIVTFFGKANQQIGNGGIQQYLDNGYASTSEQGRGWHSVGNTELQDSMIELAGSYGLFDTEVGKQAHMIFQNIDDAVQATKEECYTCKNKRYEECPECEGAGHFDEEGEPLELAYDDDLPEGAETCTDCHGEGIVPCEACNEEGQLQEDADEGELDYHWLDMLDDKYYVIGDAWLKELDAFAFKAYKDEFEGLGLLGKAGAYK